MPEPIHKKDRFKLTIVNLAGDDISFGNGSDYARWSEQWPGNHRRKLLHLHFTLLYVSIDDKHFIHARLLEKQSIKHSKGEITSVCCYLSVSRETIEAVSCSPRIEDFFIDLNGMEMGWKEIE